MIRSKQGLLDLVARAERGALLPGEAQLLRDAIDLLDDMVNTMDKLCDGRMPAEFYRGYQAETTQQMRVISLDDEAPGRP